MQCGQGTDRFFISSLKSGEQKKLFSCDVKWFDQHGTVGAGDVTFQADGATDFFLYIVPPEWSWSKWGAMLVTSNYSFYNAWVLERLQVSGSGFHETLTLESELDLEFNLGDTIVAWNRGPSNMTAMNISINTPLYTSRFKEKTTCRVPNKRPPAYQVWEARQDPVHPYQGMRRQMKRKTT